MKKELRILFLLCFVMMVGKKVYAQQDALVSQYMYNPLVINPAYAGADLHKVDASLWHRNQWTSIEGAPVSQSLSVHGPVDFKEHIGVGLQLFNEQIGSQKNNCILTSYSYKLKIAKGKLSLGLRAGVFSYNVNRSKLDYREQNDNQSLYNYNRKVVPSFDFGTYYYTDNYFFGIAANHLNQPAFYSQRGAISGVVGLVRSYLVNAGYYHKLNENVIIKPSVLVRSVGNAPLNYDINTNVCFLQSICVGLSYRSNTGLVFLSEYIYKKAWRIGYSFDWLMNNKIPNFRSPTHEIYLGYDLRLHKHKTKTNSLRF